MPCTSALAGEYIVLRRFPANQLADQFKHFGGHAQIAPLAVLGFSGVESDQLLFETDVADP